MKLSFQRSKYLDGVSLVSNGVAAIQLGELILLTYFNGTGDVGYSSSIHVKETLKMSHFYYGSHIWCIFDNEVLVSFDLYGRRLAHTNVTLPSKVELFEIGKDLCIYPYGIFRANLMSRCIHDVISLPSLCQAGLFYGTAYLPTHKKLVISSDNSVIGIDLTGLTSQTPPRISKILSETWIRGLGSGNDDTVLLYLNNGCTALDYTLTYITEGHDPFGKRVFGAFAQEAGFLEHIKTCGRRNLLIFRRNSGSQVFLQKGIPGEDWTIQFLGKVTYPIMETSFHYPWVFLKSKTTSKWNTYLIEE